MSIAQIHAILTLLLVFGVGQPTVDTVQKILEARNNTPQVQQMPVLSSSGVRTLESDSVATIQDCTPTLSAQIIKIGGNINTGIDFLFVGTSTIPTGCSLNTNTENDLKTQGFPNDITYHGNISDWTKNNQINYIKNGFTFSQGWGTGSGVVPSGSFIWSVGSTSITTSI